jgi:hypothetical protein
MVGDYKLVIPMAKETMVNYTQWKNLDSKEREVIKSKLSLLGIASEDAEQFRNWLQTLLNCIEGCNQVREKGFYLYPAANAYQEEMLRDAVSILTSNGFPIEIVGRRKYALLGIPFGQNVLLVRWK